jgi:2-methylisocitrate lyase-like PEP mutase family enzyme
MVDGDDGYGDAKNVTYTTRAFEALGVQAIFLEDQRAPKECGHMDNKKVVPPEVMVNKIRAAVDARSSSEFFILARRDKQRAANVHRARKMRAARQLRS